jgi:hypothetical protein
MQLSNFTRQSNLLNVAHKSLDGARMLRATKVTISCDVNLIINGLLS